ncbi:hypothetical protein AXK12_02410 [Cephaloticoccus capnophilus]|uniref:Coproporphyrinogen III oxidase n=1 Tax=Cephaloticoccus capnophilus TaxID=1548208 RepID=A0A139SR28_9BACT|nr:hypothetical protein AXK12_02410 [Cephaloticoccus capnophilus]
MPPVHADEAPSGLRIKKPSVAVIGGGITGLAAAHRLAARGVRVRLFEKSERAGGVIGTEQSEGAWLIERGPNSLLESGPAGATLRALVAELGLKSQTVPANPLAKKRYLVREGRPLAVPTSPIGLARSPLLSSSATWSILRELLRRRPTAPRPNDISLADFVRDHFCQEIVDYVLNPFVSGVYAGAPEKLSAQHAFPALWKAEQTHGSLLRAQIAAGRERRKRGEPRPQLFSFRRGLQTLTDALAHSLPPDTLQLGTTVRAIHQSADGGWEIETDAGQEAAAAVLCALPAHALAALRIGEETPLASLAEIEHPPVSTLFLGYRREQVAHPLDGFGMLVPKVEKLPLLGVIFSSTLFPERAPKGHVALQVMLGGAACDHRQLGARVGGPAPFGGDSGNPPSLGQVQLALAQLLGVRGDPVFLRSGHFAQAIPQYTLGHEKHLAAMTDCEARHPGLFIGGQCRDGISTPACIASGERLAAQALSQLGL